MNQFSNISQLMSRKDSRKLLCEQRIDIFARYYLGRIFAFPEADFQKKDWEDLLFKSHNLLLMLQFRESGKTMRTFAKVLHSICFRRSRFICLFALDKRKASKINYEISLQLQTNRRLIDDFGQLFYEETTGKDKFSKSKSRGEFITTNLVKLKAFSLKTSLRGEVYITKEGESFRPTLLVLDDMDTIASLKNPRIIAENWSIIKSEILGGVEDDCEIIVLGNVIKDDGLAIRFEKDCATNPFWICNRVAVFKNVKEKKKITWQRYVRTDEEARILNENILDKKRKFISLEKKRRDLGEIAYNQNFLLIADKGQDAIIKQEWIQFFDPRDSRALKPDAIRIGVDPAISEKTQADYFAISVVGWKLLEIDDFGDEIYRYFVYENHKFEGADKDDLKTTKFIKGLYNKYHDTPAGNNIRVNFESVVFSALYGKMYKRKGMAVDEIFTTRDKITRAKEKQAIFEQGNVLFQRGGEGLEGSGGLIENITNFPAVVHDDQFDSLLLAMDEGESEEVGNVNLA